MHRSTVGTMGPKVLAGNAITEHQLCTDACRIHDELTTQRKD